MTETKKRTKKAQGTPEPKKRTRETNPIYQGPYTIEDYLRGEFTPEKLEFIQRFSVLAPEERERLEAIDRQAKEQYDGPESWAVGDLWDIPDYLPGNISPLDYYRTFYELDDTLAVSKRLEQIRAMAEYMKFQNMVFVILQNTLSIRYPEFEEAVKRRTALIEKTRLEVTKEAEELTEASRRMCASVVNNREALGGLKGFFENEEDGEAQEDEELTPREMERLRALDNQIRETIETLEREAETLELFANLSYEELAEDGTVSKALAILEETLPEDVFNSEFEAFRLAHPGDGYRDAITRILKGMIWNLGYSGEPTEWIPEDPMILRAQCKSAIARALALQRGLKERLESYKAYIDGDDSKSSKRMEAEGTVSTLEMAKTHPYEKPETDLIPHDYFSLKVGTPAMRQAYIEEFSKLEGRFPYRKEEKDAYGKIIKGEIKNRITITNLEGELTAEDMALTSTIASLQRSRNPKGYRDKDLEAPLYVSENELLKYYYGLEGKEPDQEQREWLSRWVERRATHRVEIDFRETLREFPELREILSRNFPDGQAHAGIIGDYDLPSRYEYSRNPTKTKRINKDGTVTEEYEYTKWYYFPRYPITIYYSMVLNQSSLLDTSLRETPTLREGGEDRNGLSPRVIHRLDEMERGGLKLWKIKEGVRYISLSKSPDFPKMKWVILSKIEAMVLECKKKRAREFTLSLDELGYQVWGKCSASADRDHRRYMMTYLIYLMNNPKSPVYDVHPIKKGKRQAQNVRIELYPEELPRRTGGERSLRYHRSGRTISSVGILAIQGGILAIQGGILAIQGGILAILGAISYITRD